MKEAKEPESTAVHTLQKKALPLATYQLKDKRSVEQKQLMHRIQHSPVVRRGKQPGGGSTVQLKNILKSQPKYTVDGNGRAKDMTVLGLGYTDTGVTEQQARITSANTKKGQQRKADELVKVFKAADGANTPQGDPEGWKDLKARGVTWEAPRYVRMHLLNGGLGGTGKKEKNLAPGSHALNKWHDTQVEHGIKVALASTPEGTLDYKVSVEYRKGDAIKKPAKLYKLLERSAYHAKATNNTIAGLKTQYAQRYDTSQPGNHGKALSKGVNELWRDTLERIRCTWVVRDRHGVETKEKGDKEGKEAAHTKAGFIAHMESGLGVLATKQGARKQTETDAVRKKGKPKVGQTDYWKTPRRITATAAVGGVSKRLGKRRVVKGKGTKGRGKRKQVKKMKGMRVQQAGVTNMRGRRGSYLAGTTRTNFTMRQTPPHGDNCLIYAIAEMHGAQAPTARVIRSIRRSVGITRGYLPNDKKVTDAIQRHVLQGSGGAHKDIHYIYGQGNDNFLDAMTSGNSHGGPPGFIAFEGGNHYNSVI